MTEPQITPKDRRPRMYPAPEFPPRKPALFARTPPAVFPVLLGLLGLGLALRRGLEPSVCAKRRDPDQGQPYRGGRRRGGGVSGGARECWAMNCLTSRSSRE